MISLETQVLVFFLSGRLKQVLLFKINERGVLQIKFSKRIFKYLIL